MNTPAPCCFCKHCEYDVLSMEDPNSSAYCKKDLLMGKPKCKKYIYWGVPKMNKPATKGRL